MLLLFCWLFIACFHLLRPSHRSSQRLQYWMGLVVSLGLGLSTLWISIWYSNLSFFESDFSEYCVAVMEMEKDWLHGDIPPKRTRLAAWLPSILSNGFGVIDGFALSSSLCTVLIFMLVYIWGAALGGVGAGVLSVGALWMMSPMILLSRFFTFYPPIVLATVFGAMGVSLFGRFRTPWTALVCGVGIGSCLLIDVRGVVWAVPFWIGALCLLSANLKAQNVLSGLLLHLPIWLSWFGGWWSFSANASSLEKQMDVRPLYVGFDEGNPLLQPPWDIDSHFVWGWFQPQEIGQTIQFIWRQRNLPVPADFVAWQSSTDGPVLEIRFWTVVMLCSLVAACCSMWRRSFGKNGVERILLLLCSVSPFLLLFHSLQSLVEQHIRFYMHVMPGIAILMGVGLAQQISWQRLSWLPLGKAWFAVLWMVCAVVLVLGLHTVSFSPFHPKASWRHTWRLNAHDWGRIKRSQTNEISLKPYDQTCAERLEGESMVPTIYPY